MFPDLQTRKLGSVAKVPAYQRVYRSQLIVIVKADLLYSKCKGEKIYTPNSSRSIKGLWRNADFLTSVPTLSSTQIHQVPPGELSWEKIIE